MITADSASAEDVDGNARWRGSWILLVFLLTMFAANSVSVRDLIEGQIGGPLFRPGDEPPFYYIEIDVIRGISAAVGIVAVFTFTTFTWSYSRLYSHTAQWMTLLWMAPHVACAIDIWIRCENLFTEQATGPWPTFDSYLDDPRKWIVFYGTLILSGFYSVSGNWLFRGQNNKQQVNS